MAINALTVRRLADQRQKQQIRDVMQKPTIIPVRWVLCWGKIDYRTGKWDWKSEHAFENRTAAIANKNSFMRYPVADQNTCYVVRRYYHGIKPESTETDNETVEILH